MKALQLSACVSYLLVGAAFFVVAAPANILVTLVILIVSFVVMIARAYYARSKGLWAHHYSWSIEAAQPERTAVVTLGLLVLTIIVATFFGFDTPSNDKSTDVIVTLFLTGGLFTALITSPHTLRELAERHTQDSSSDTHP